MTTQWTSGPGKKALFALVVFSIICVARGKICESDVCEFNFDIRWSQTMTYYDGKKGFSVGMNGSDLQIIENGYRTKEDHKKYMGNPVNASDVNTADGTSRDIIVINGKYPGPTIEVMEGAQVVVHIKNNLKLEAVTIHWHGLHQVDTPFMDGTAFITQCPITPGQSFTYRFKADPAGTHWYHTHLHQQLVAGAVGMLIVHREKPKIPYFLAALSDWFHCSPAAFDFSNPYVYSGIRVGGEIFTSTDGRYFGHDNAEVSGVKFEAALINGKGRFKETDSLGPLEEFVVTTGTKYRFRMVNMAAEFYFEVSIDDHQLEIVALDGQEIRPIKADSFIIGAGERVDFEIKAEQLPSSYWLRATTLRYGNGVYPKADDIIHAVKGIVHYRGSSSFGDPDSRARLCTEEEPCAVYGCAWSGYAVGTNKTCIGLEQAKSPQIQRDFYGLDDDEDVIQEHFLNFAYGIGSSVNARQFLEPEVTLLGQRSANIPNRCEDEDCVKGCVCTNILDLDLSKPIQLVVSNVLSGVQGHHSVHLHGYNFAVIKVGYPEYNQTTGFRAENNPDLKCNNPQCSAPSWNQKPNGLNLADPPIKDTIIVPAGGYIILRFRTKNPGYWLMHCHQVTHHSEGMAMVINVGEDQQPTLPPDFPKCDPFDFTAEQYTSYISGDHKPSKEGTTTDDRPPAVKPTEKPADDPETGQYVFSQGQVIGGAVGIAVGGLVVGILLALLCVQCKRN